MKTKVTYIFYVFYIPNKKIKKTEDKINIYLNHKRTQKKRAFLAINSPDGGKMGIYKKKYFNICLLKNERSK